MSDKPPTDPGTIGVVCPMTNRVRAKIIRYLTDECRDGKGEDSRTIAARIGEDHRRVASVLGQMKRDGQVERHDTRGQYAYADDPINWRLVGQLEYWEAEFKV